MFNSIYLFKVSCFSRIDAMWVKKDDICRMYSYHVSSVKYLFVFNVTAIDVRYEISLEESKIVYRKKITS